MIYSELYHVESIDSTHFEITPRAILKNGHSTVELDYHSHLLFLKETCQVKMEIYVGQQPTLPKNIYLTRGIIYKIAEGKFSASFGGLLLIYNGNLSNDIQEGMEIYAAFTLL